MLCTNARLKEPILAFSQFVAGEIAEAVVRGVFEHFAQRRIVEDLVDELVDSEAVVEHHHPDMNELRGRFADDA